MEYVGDFCIRYFALICLSIVMIINAIPHYHYDRKISLCSILITASCFVLAIANFTQEIVKPLGYYYFALTLSIIGYILRPICLYLFILMNKNSYRGKYSFLIWLPLVINALVYLCAFIPGTKEIIFGFYVSESGSLSFSGGPLRFTAHIISFCYLAYLLYVSIFTLKSKHFMHGVTLLICATFVLIAAIMETFFNGNNDIELLNITIMISTMTYYLFLYKENMQVDPLTGMFNRDTYYRDIPKMTNTFTGIVQFDINGLKFINDNFGHHEGDKCIAKIAKCIRDNLTRSMYGYRMGGDEFLVIVNNEKEETIKNLISAFKEELSKTTYFCSVGYAIKDEKYTNIESVIRQAEKSMYNNKAEFYKGSPFERRKV